MPNKGPFQTPFVGAFDTPSGDGANVTQRGGEDLGEGTVKESANLSDLPMQPNRWDLGPGDPGTNGHVEPIDLNTTRTIKTTKD